MSRQNNERLRHKSREGTGRKWLDITRAAAAPATRGNRCGCAKEQQSYPGFHQSAGES
jgi:hypothetical protein